MTLLSLFSTPLRILLDRFNTESSFLNAIIFCSKTAILGSEKVSNPVFKAVEYGLRHYKHFTPYVVRWFWLLTALGIEHPGQINTVLSLRSRMTLLKHYEKYVFDWIEYGKNWLLCREAQIITCHSYGVLIAWLTFNYKHFTPYGVWLLTAFGIEHPGQINTGRAQRRRPYGNTRGIRANWRYCYFWRWLRFHQAEKAYLPLVSIRFSISFRTYSTRRHFVTQPKPQPKGWERITFLNTKENLTS